MSDSSGVHYRTFVLLLVVVTIAFGWLLWPFYGAVFWGTILAILFAPLQRRLVARIGGRRNLAALITLLLVLLLVILPLVVISGSLVNEGANFYQSIKSGQINFGAYFQQAMDALPPSVHALLARFDLADIASLQDKLTAGAMQASQFLATQALNIGQDTFQFVVSFGIMLYLLFFLLRDGPLLSARLRRAVPLSDTHKQHLFRKFTTVVRATVKGNVAVAAAQGALGGIIFSILSIQGALLWGVIMAFLSLLPAIGAGLIWAPVAVYFLLTGAVVKGAVLIAFGVLVIGMVDNVLRPILVGKDTKMPDYVILISTLGGMALFGLNGFVIGPLIAALFMASWDLFSPAAGDPGGVHAVSAPLPGNPVAGSPPASGGAGARAQAALASDRQSRDV
ncbi:MULTISPECIES: AI-2E family transporter [Achromobacter]|uniref:AI-2E family transporter n=1 Tax=Achromobacter TaxID=222 RepID=UPI000A5679E6|nr:AI-2E family transporter [Achromobacter mucicolens]MDH1524472.1 AI-2E family transporter [Achromobacter mucicolens]